jgi:glutamine amidotransferase-like uncharacterized protein
LINTSIKNYAKPFYAVLVILVILVASFLVLNQPSEQIQSQAIILSAGNANSQDAINVFRLVNELLENDFKVFLIDNETVVNNGLTKMERGDFIVPPQSNGLFPSSQNLLVDYANKQAQELNVTVEKVNFNFEIEALPLKKPTVAIYSGGGAAGGVLEHLYPLQNAGFDIQILNSTDIENHDLTNFNVLTFPGGGAYWNYQNDKAVSEIKDFVSNGNGFVGTCDGAAFGVDTGLLEAHKMVGALYPEYDEYADIRGPLTLKIIQDDLLTVGYKDFLPSVYFRGPFIDDVGEGVDVVALLNSTTNQTQIYFPEIVEAYNFSLNADSINRTWNTPAVISGMYGLGKVVLSTVHPEILLESQRFFINFVYFALSGERMTVAKSSFLDTSEEISGVNSDVNSPFNESTFSAVISSIQTLREDSNAAAYTLQVNLETNYKLVGVVSESLNTFLKDISQRGETFIVDLESLRDNYGILENIRGSLERSNDSNKHCAGLLAEAENLQKEIAQLVNIACANLDFHEVMRTISAELSNQNNDVGNITSSHNDTSRGQAIIALYNSEVSTLAKLQHISEFLIPVSLKAVSLLARIDFLETAYTLN